jgi:hypothetical protein
MIIKESDNPPAQNVPPFRGSAHSTTLARKMILVRALYGGIGFFISKGPLGAWRVLAALCCMAAPLSAATSGNFNYTDNGTYITITGSPISVTGAVAIPSTINGKPVTSIGPSAFFFSSGLTSVSIPSSVTSIGSYAFSNCKGLASILVDAANPNYSSSDGVLFNKPLTSLIRCPGGKSGAYTIPSGVTSIEISAFDSCSGLTSVTIPAGVTSIGNGAFAFCSGLTSASFMGNAPATFGSSVFTAVASGFTVVYLNGSVGFTSPTWQGYPAQGIQGTQTIIFGALSAKTYGDAPFTVSATASSGLTPTFTIVSGPATISSATVTLTGAGTVVVRASQAGNASYAAATPVDQSFIINTALQSWRQLYFDTTANIGTAADSAVSNLDGLPNLVEYALGGIPPVANSAIPPRLGTVASNGATCLTLTFTPQRSDITYAIEVSGDLSGAWTSVPLAGLLTMGQAYTYTDTVAVAAGAPRFLRLRVTGE